MPIECLIAFIWLLLTILGLVVLWKSMNIGGKSRIDNLGKFLELWKNNPEPGSRTILILSFSPVVLAGGFRIFITASGGLMVAAFIAVCGPPGSLETIRGILTDIFDFMRDILAVDRKDSFFTPSNGAPSLAIE